MVKQMTTSVAMCTYNGARFVEEQLRSILDQTIPVGEIVICDDGSTDETIAIIEKVAKETTIPVYIHINERNLGCVANFEKAIRLCQGDIIFLSDQDDVWMPNKAETIVEYFKTNKDKSVIISNADLIDEKGEMVSDVKLFDVIGLSEQLEYFDKGYAPELFLQCNRATGCTMALRRTFIPNMNINVKVVPNTRMQIHDGCIAMSAALKNALGYVNEPLTMYRQHLSQTCGLGGWINVPMHYPSPLIPRGYYDTSYGISHFRLEMQYLRGHKYSRYGSIIMHINHYYKAYGLELMWSVVGYDVYIKVRRIIRMINHLVNLLLNPFFRTKRTMMRKSKI